MQTNRFLLTIVFLVATAPLAHAQIFRDVGFEDGVLGECPTGWFVYKGWKAEFTEEYAAAGSQSVKLFKTGEPADEFGNLMITEYAAEFAGQHVKLSSKIKVVGEGRGQMWLRVDRRAGVMGAFDNMDDRPILAGDWQPALIEADIESDALSLNFGFMSLGGAATLYVDDVRIEISGNPRRAQPLSPAHALTSQGTANLTAAAKLLAYVRFFHPSDQAVGVASWDHFAVDLMKRCEPAADAGELAERLKDAFAGVAPTLDVWAGTPAQAPPRHVAPTEIQTLTIWRHIGLGSVHTNIARNIYSSSVWKTTLNAFPGGIDAAYVVKSLGAGVSCRVPIAIFTDERGTLPHGETPVEYASMDNLAVLTPLNRATRLAGVALAWGIFQHFYPYFDVVDTDWEAILPAALAKAAEDIDDQAYLATLREMTAQLHDGHGRVTQASTRSTSSLPLATEWAGKDLTVVGIRAGAPDSVSIGDVIVSIDDVPIEECDRKISRQISAATEGWRRYCSQRYLTVTLSTQDPAQIVFRKPDGRTYEASIARIAELSPGEYTSRSAMEKRPENAAELAPGIVYFNLCGAEEDALVKALPALTTAKAIVFDIRGYPKSAAMLLIRHLIDVPVTSARWCVPLIRRPDREDVEWIESDRWNLTPLPPRLTAPIAFLTDGRAISYAESILGIIEYYKFGEIVGATSAGTNGNVNNFTIPGGYTFSWTGMKVLKHDGSQHHGVGIHPTVPVTPTAAGIAAGRDEVLEKAVEILQAKIAGVPVE